METARAADSATPKVVEAAPPAVAEAPTLMVAEICTPKVAEIPTPKVAEAPTPKAAPAVPGTGEAAAAAKASSDEGVDIHVYSANAAWREVYNDAGGALSTVDTDNSVDSIANAEDRDSEDDDDEEIIDVGEEVSWSETAIPVPPAASGYPGPGQDSEARVEAQAGIVEVRPAAIGAVVVGDGGDGGDEEPIRSPGGAMGQEDSDSLQGEADGVDALVANAMALADAAERDAEGLPEADDGQAGAGMGGLGGFDAGAFSVTGDGEYPSPRGSVRDVVNSGVFGSAKSHTSWAEGGDDEGEAEREAEEVQNLVAEALALVEDANNDF